MKAYQASVLFFIPEQQMWSAISSIIVTNKTEQMIVAECEKEVRIRWINPTSISVMVDLIEDHVIRAIKDLK